MTIATNSKASVLVILPPTHKGPDLERVLKLARKAFDDLSLNILDLNLRFAWVSDDELQPESTDHSGAAPSLAANGLSLDKVNSNHPALPQIGAMPAPPAFAPPAIANATPPVHKLSGKGADLSCFRIFFTDIAPTLTDADIVAMCPPDSEIVGATLYPPRPLGYRKSMVRSAVFAFAKAKHAKEYQDWIKQSAANGSLAGKLMTKSILTIFLPQLVSLEETLSEPNKIMLFGGSQAASPPVANGPTVFSPSVSAAAMVPNDLPEATDRDWRLVAGNFIGTLSKQEIINSIVPQGVMLTGATMHAPSPLGKGRPEMVQFIKLAFASKAHAYACYDWIKSQSEVGGVVRKVITPNGKLSLNEPGAPRPSHGAVVRVPSTRSLSTAPAGPPSIVPPAVSSATQQVASSATVSHSHQPGHALPLSAQELPAGIPSAQDSHWRIKVGNLRPSAPVYHVLEKVIPPCVDLAGATIHGPRPLGTGRPELIHYMTLAFHSQSDARTCIEWILSRADAGGPLTDVVSREARVDVSRTVAAPISFSSSSHSAAATDPPSSSVISSPSATIPEANPSSPYRLTVGNILHHLTREQLLANLLPPSILPAGMTLHPPQQLTGRPDKCRYIALDFKSERDAQLAHDWILSQAVTGGRVASMLPPNVKAIIALLTPGSPSSSATAASKPIASSNSHAPPPSSASPTSSFSLTSISDLPEASPSNFRLHVSNLDPNLELAQIIPALVPRDVKLVGASLFAPRPMGGSRRELVRSLKFAFLTEWDAKRCQQWIKQDLGGGVAKVALQGAKIGVGNPMDPMTADLEAEHSESTGNGAVGDEHLRAPVAPQPPTWPRSYSPKSPATSPSSRPDVASHPTSRSPSVSSATSSHPAPPAAPSLFHISLVGIDPSKPVSTVFSTILGSLTGPVEPVRMGVRNANGRRGAEFVFDSEAMAKQFVLRVWTGIKAGKYAAVTAEGEELKIARGSTGRGAGE